MYFHPQDQPGRHGPPKLPGSWLLCGLGCGRSRIKEPCRCPIERWRQARVSGRGPRHHRSPDVTRPSRNGSAIEGSPRHEPPWSAPVLVPIIYRGPGGLLRSRGNPVEMGRPEEDQIPALLGEGLKPRMGAGGKRHHRPPFPEQADEVEGLPRRKLFDGGEDPGRVDGRHDPPVLHSLAESSRREKVGQSVPPPGG